LTDWYATALERCSPRAPIGHKGSALLESSGTRYGYCETRASNADGTLAVVARLTRHCET